MQEPFAHWSNFSLPINLAKIDRAAHLRNEDLEPLASGARYLIFGRDGFLTHELQLALLPHGELAEYSNNAERYFLGQDSAATSYFLIDAPNVVDGVSALRELKLSSDLTSLASHGQALANWHRRHKFCAICGAATIALGAGSYRSCPSCQSEHYPRTDPAIIVLTVDSDDRILLGHQKVWAENRFSTFAGFVEPGETFEQAVHRELFEESRLRVNRLRYLASQPWPYPASLMVAFVAEVNNPDEAEPDKEEITEIRALSRSQLLSQVKGGSLALPPQSSVARAMINYWYSQGEGFDVQDFT